MRHNKRKNFILLTVSAFLIAMMVLFLYNALIKIKKYNMESYIIRCEFKKAEIKQNINNSAYELCDILINQIGKPYKYGYDGPDTFDCSGLTEYSYSKIGIKLPRTVIEQSKIGKLVNKNNLKFGDLLFFSDDGKTLTHTGIYVGNGYFIHSPKIGDVVKLSNLNTEYYSKTFKKAMRILKF